MRRTKSYPVTPGRTASVAALRSNTTNTSSEDTGTSSDDEENGHGINRPRMLPPPPPQSSPRLIAEPIQPPFAVEEQPDYDGVNNDERWASTNEKQDDEEEDRQRQRQHCNSPSSFHSHPNNTHPTNHNAAAVLVRNIASFLTLSDAASLASFAAVPTIGAATTYSAEDDDASVSWAVGGTVGVPDEEERVGNDDELDYNYYTGTDDPGLLFFSENNNNNDGSTTMNVNNNNPWWGSPIGRTSNSSSTLVTPVTPALVAISPGATPRHHPNPVDDEIGDDDKGDTQPRRMTGSMEQTTERRRRWRNTRGVQQQPGRMNVDTVDNNSWDDSDHDRLEQIVQERRRKWAQEKITSAVFSHPKSMRSFCWEAHVTAKDIRMQNKRRQRAMAAAAAAGVARTLEKNPETQVEPTESTSTRGNAQLGHAHRTRKTSGHPFPDLRAKIVHEIVDWICHRVPISVLLDVLEATGWTIRDTTGASCTITISTIQHTVAALGAMVFAVWDTITHCVTNPFQVLEAIISLQFNAMGKTSEVLVSGIQSVATGVGSASGLALYRLSATANMSSSVTSLVGSTPGDGKFGSVRQNQRLLHRLSAINDAALVVAYREREQDTCGLTRHAVSRTRRMMHYSVSLKPFVATVTVSTSAVAQPSVSRLELLRSDEGVDISQESGDVLLNPTIDWTTGDDSLEISSDEEYSPFMCTPQSFPATPHSRQTVIAQRLQLSDDVVFLARDRLRIHDGLGSDNARTRELSQALEVEKRLAIFACDKDSGIELTCGRHIATKCGNAYYASARSMVAVLRNCFVYFEITVLPQQPMAPPVATLSIGLSTEEMPPNTLVGAWPSSVGLCTTGQLLMAGQWCSPADPASFAYGVGSTVGCLVCLDNESTFETWDGVMVKATIRFTINGVAVSPPVATLPMNGASTGTTLSSAPTSAMLMGNDRLVWNSFDASSPLKNTVSSRIEESLLCNSPPPTSPPPTTATTMPPTPTLSLLVPSLENLYPTVTLQSPATSVVCRFSSADVMVTTRELIGAPIGVAVYAIDGSVLLQGHEASTAQQL